MRYIKYFNEDKLIFSDLEKDMKDFFLSEMDFDVDIITMSLIVIDDKSYLICPKCGMTGDGGDEICGNCGNEVILPSEDSYIEGAFTFPKKISMINDITKYIHYEYIVSTKGSSRLGISKITQIYQIKSADCDSIISDLDNKQLKRLNSILKDHQMELYYLDSPPNTVDSYFISDIKSIENFLNKMTPDIIGDIDVVVYK